MHRKHGQGQKALKNKWHRLQTLKSAWHEKDVEFLTFYEILKFIQHFQRWEVLRKEDATKFTLHMPDNNLLDEKY